MSDERLSRRRADDALATFIRATHVAFVLKSGVFRLTRNGRRRRPIKAPRKRPQGAAEHAFSHVTPRRKVGAVVSWTRATHNVAIGDAIRIGWLPFNLHCDSSLLRLATRFPSIFC